MSRVRRVIDDALVAEAVHDTGVRRLQHAYADVVNRRAWPELSELFLPEATVVIDRRSGDPLLTDRPGPTRASSSAASIEQFEFFEFVILNAHIVFPERPAAGTAVSRLFMCELRQHRDSGRRTNAYGLYHDRYTFDSGRWWFAERRVPLAGPARPGARHLPLPRPDPASRSRARH